LAFAKVLNLDRVFSGATCMLIASAMRGLVKSGPGRRRVDIPTETLPCVCNASYISHACRGAEGLVFEDGDSRLGSLIID
jgi:hypothetical protein